MGFEQVFAAKVKAGQGQVAAAELVARYNGCVTVQDARRAYSAWSRTRGILFHDNTNANPDYPAEIEMLAEEYPDYRDRLMDLLTKPLPARHKVESIKNQSYTDDPEVDAVLKEIRPLQPYFYEFMLPEDINQRARDGMVERRGELQSQHRGTFTVEEANQIMDTAIGYIRSHHHVHTVADVIRLGICVALLTGRRISEVMERATFSPTPHPFQIRVKGLAKMRDYADDPNEYVVPTLMPVEELLRAIAIIRSSGKNTSYSNTTAYYKQVFGRTLGHDKSRSLYLELAWSRRMHENQFRTDLSRNDWQGAAIVHGVQHSSLSHYQNYDFVN